jgi:4'-phosphopantetheinyl transferase
VVARGALRDVLGRYLGRRADQVAFAYNAFGKPELSPELGARLGFNLSHSSELALIAVAADAPVGVDLECVEEERGAHSAHAEIARYFFPEAEADHLSSVPLELRPQAFFSCWTRREAYLKARGQGLTEGRAEVSGRWSFFALQPAPGYIGALAVEGDGWHLEQRPWVVPGAVGVTAPAGHPATLPCAPG